MVLRVMLVLVAAALLAGCGGGDDETREDKIASCLKKDYGDFVSTERTDLDVLTAASMDGGISVITEKNQVNISLHKTEDVAKKAVKIYEAGRAPPKKLERFGSAVVAYTAKPTAQDERTIENCLKED